MPDDFQEVQVPGHGTFRFPAGMTRDQMEPLLRSRVQELGGSQAVAPKPYTERALPWETPKPGQQQAQWNELPGALAEFGKHVYEGIKSAASLPGETFEAGYKGQVPQGLGGQVDQGDFEDRAFNLVGLAASGGKFGKTPSIQPAVTQVQKILSPQSVSPIAGEAAGSIRAAGGTAARDTATTAAAMEPYHRVVNALPDAERLAFINHVEGRSNNFYRGSAGADDFSDPNKLGGVFFTKDKEYAEAMARRAAHRRGGSPKVKEYELDIKNPHLGGVSPQIAREAGHDAISYGGTGKANETVVFDKSQISSVRLSPELKSLADTLKTEFDKRMVKLQALPSTQHAAFIQDYFPHFWQDPKAAQQFAQNYSGGAGKQGSGASLKKRTIPTIADGIAAGLKPLTTDPIEATMRYVSSMDRFIAATDVLDTAKANNTVRYFRPKVMGASGHPESMGSNVAPSGPIPEGWVPLKGRGATNHLGQTAYAPEDWARVYNNFISKGFHGNIEAGKVYDAVQGASNSITALELGLSGYHAFTMANEAIISDVARGISNVVGGKPIKGVGQILTAPTAPIRAAMRGHKAEQVYLGRSQGTPDMRRIVDLQTQAGGRAVGKGHAADYRFSAMGSYWTAFKRGALKQEMRQSLANIKAQPLIGAAKEAGKMIGRVMETVAQPIFEKYIPKIKNGAFYDTMKDWLEANPTASHEQQAAMARKIWDSIDNRFGEMVQDNIFWNKTLKQSAQLGMRSYSWNLGTVREIGGGAISAIKDPRKLSMAHQDYDPRVAYVVAMPIVVATANAVYQFLKTGQAPESVDDLVAGRTGGTAPGFGGRGSVDERASLPGYQKDVLGWYHDWKQEALNKQSRMLQLTEELLSGKDFQGHLLSQPDSSTPAWLTDYFTHVMSSMVPISVQQLGRGQKIGSEVSTPESLMGIRPAPGYLQDPEGTERGMHRIKAGEWKRGQKSQRRQQSQYGGPQE